MIYDSPSHIYHSALPFSPSSSWLRQCYKEELAQEVEVVTGLPDEWDTCPRTIFFDVQPLALAYRGDVIAVGSTSNEVVILDAITGSRNSLFSGHTNTISSLAFSSDGMLLVSGSKDKTVKLWDVQTGGTVKTFSDHTSAVSSVSISPDRTMVVSGSRDGMIYLWDIETGERLHLATRHWSEVTAVSFQPTNSQRFISSSTDSTVQQWDIDGHMVGHPHLEADEVAHVTYSLDGTCFVSCGGTAATVRDSESGGEVVKLQSPKQIFRYCSFSPNGRFVACAAADEIHVWDITSVEPHLIGNFVGHTEDIISIIFSSSLISGSKDRSVKFWQIGTSPKLMNSTMTGDMPMLLASAAIESGDLSEVTKT